MIDPHSILTWEGEIQYGEYVGSIWHSVGGWDHPLFQRYLNDIKSNSEVFEGFNLYVTGGLLEDWHSWDIDWVLTGPYVPERIIKALHCLVERGFHHSLYPDVHYSKYMYSNYDWQRNGKEHADWYYELSNVFIKNGLKADMSMCQSVDGMWRRWLPHPGEKTLKKHREGYKYQKPVQIF